ncbi:adenosylmethionine decarboxylase [Shewanella psychrotolerans]|uniref:adenosylmethionine decarboxylase n=1 Tax=Shewanella psychrotolerans TaxID=2864206 RepID=UPI001C65E72C|nr:adenosylmethionine decarboxylase [Shewanella psychrotolerans]QYK00109.1 adenosylmethionine decarboxylase [Shewanella psychrotolerans]
MFFEGAEKRIEIVVDEFTSNLREFGDLFWQTALAKAGASVLSTISNDYCDAYVLSESSLFVWKNKILLITCGNTSLIDTSVQILESVGVNHLKWFSYQRKSELYAHLQTSRFEDDVIRLKQYVDGHAYRVGHLDGHHHYLFYSEPLSSLQRFSALQMYHIKGALADYLLSEQQHKSHILTQLQLDSLLPKFKFDDWLFSPCGYSINGIYQDDYITMHITPQEPNSYVSIETNLADRQQVSNIFSNMLNIFNPRSWDVVGFNAHLPANGMECSVLLAQCRLALNTKDNLYINQYRELACEQLAAVEL